ncbi:MAG: hypothetical protein IAG10_07415, partial [Planctomycetaceae bacterium]|nr:hypothetical protein [Planctomycetaceae bacterium]
LKWDDIRKKTIKDEVTGRERVDVPEAYRTAREKVVSDAFLALRSRREQDFVDYFSISILATPRYLAQDDYRTVAQALLKTPDDVKTLTLLALSANS